jgi:hypothetical protein
MRTVEAANYFRSSAILVAAIGLLKAHGETPDAPSLSLFSGPANDGTVAVTINDTANHVWILQRSPDLQHWAEVGA